MFDIGIQELIIIFVVALLVFGPDKLPEVGRTLAKWVLEIRKGIQVAKLHVESEIKETKPESDIKNYIPDELKNFDDISDKKMPGDDNTRET